MNILYIVMPAYNQNNNMKNTVRLWYPILEGKSEKSRLVIADSGSTDSTHDIILKMKKDYPKLEILSNTDKQHEPKVITLYNYSIEQGAEYIFQTDFDGQTNPDEFGRMRNKYDVILGNRVIREDGKSRIFVERIVCLLLKLYFGIKVPDAKAPFRLMNAKVIKKYINKLSIEYNLPNIMFTTYFVYYNENIVFKKISFKPRQGV